MRMITSLVFKHLEIHYIVNGLFLSCFQPNFGASLQILKVEIGGDAQSTGESLLNLCLFIFRPYNGESQENKANSNSPGYGPQRTPDHWSYDPKHFHFKV